MKSRAASFGKGAITPEMQLHCTIRYLTGSSYDDIRIIVGVSKPTFYAIIWRVFKANDSLPQFQRSLPTTQEALERAFCGSQLKTWVDGLPHECFIAADNASVCSDKLIIPFCGTN
jgi:hypothetical protein